MQEGDHRRQEPGRHELARRHDRSDAIELIVSGLTSFAIFFLPGSLHGQFANYGRQLSLAFGACRRLGAEALRDPPYPTHAARLP